MATRNCNAQLQYLKSVGDSFKKSVPNKHNNVVRLNTLHSRIICIVFCLSALHTLDAPSSVEGICLLGTLRIGSLPGNSRSTQFENCAKYDVQSVLKYYVKDVYTSRADGVAHA